MVKISADLIFLKLFSENIDNNKVLVKLLNVGKFNDLLIVFELCKNILLGNVPILPKVINKLRIFEKDLILLADKKVAFNNKIKLLLKKIHMFKILISIAEKFLLN